MSTETKPLHIVSLTVNNVLKLKAVEIVPNSETVVLTGENGAGKSSVLNSIAMVLGGADFVPARPIRDGSSKGSIAIDLGEIVATLKLSASGKTIELKSKDGATLRSPQSLLNSLWSSMCDPVQFIRLSETTEGQRKQAEILRRLLGLDFSEIEAEKKKAYDERTLVNRELTDAQVKLKQFPAVADAPDEEVRSADLLAELERLQRLADDEVQAAQAHNENNNKLANALGALKSHTADLEKTILDDEAEIATIERMLAVKRTNLEQKRDSIETNKKDIAERQKQVAALEYKDIGTIRYKHSEARKPVQEKINQADEINTKVRMHRRHKEVAAVVKEKSAKADELTTKIENLEDKKKQMLAKAEYPLPGLGFNDDGVLIDGVPFAQGSQARQLRAAIAIGLALKPRVRVILVRDASLFDKKSMEAVTQMAKDTDSQVWMEVVESNNPAAIEIADGEVVE